MPEEKSWDEKALKAADGMKDCGCAMTVLITIPVILFLLLTSC